MEITLSVHYVEITTPQQAAAWWESIRLIAEMIEKTNEECEVIHAV